MTSQTHQAEDKRKPSLQRKPAKPVRQGPVAPAPQPSPHALQEAIADPSHASPADILALQRAAGNQAVTRLIQTKLTVGPAGDKYEQEADRVAEQVVSSQPSALGGQAAVRRQEDEDDIQTKPLAASITPLVQRQEDEDELQFKPLVQRQEDEDELQFKPLVQRQEDEDDLQFKPAVAVQRQEDEDDLQFKPAVAVQRQEDEDDLQFKPAVAVQRQEDEDDLQFKPAVAVQRQEDEDDLQFKPAVAVQRRADGGFEAGPDVESRLASHKGGGSPLPGEVRATMEPRFGADFGGVRVHTGGEAEDLNRQLSAQAFTHGQDIYMSAGKYAPGTPGGNRLLAHELTHTIQQQAVPKVQSSRQPVQLKPAATIQRGITDWFKKKLGKGKQAAPGEQIAIIRLKVDKAHGGVGHTWVSIYYDIDHSPPSQAQVDELGLLPYSKNRLLADRGAVPVGFWPLHTMRFASAEEEADKKASYTAKVLRGKTPGGGRTLASGHTGFSTNILHAWVPGRVEEPDKGHEGGLPDESRPYPVTQAQLKSASDYINSHREGTYSAYGIMGNNCTSFAINVLKAAGQSPPDASRLGVSTPDILAKNVGAVNAKERGPAVVTPEPVKVPMSETVALQRLNEAGLSEGDIIKLRANMPLQQIVNTSLSPETTRSDLQDRCNTPERLEALAFIMGISKEDVEQQISMLR